MSYEQEIYDCLVAHYPTHMKTITELSFNRAGSKNFIGASEQAFDFDLVFNLSPAYQQVHNEKSPDALFCVNDKLVFLEFKEGKHKKLEIRSKIHEGIVTLFMFVKRYLPHISKADFCNLNITYALVSREDYTNISFEDALKATMEKHQLKNLEGFLVSRTFYAVDQSKIANLLSGLTNGALRYIDYYDSKTAGVTRVNV